MTGLKEQCVCKQFGFKLGKNATKTSETLQTASEEETMEKKRVFIHFSHLKSVKTSAEDVECLGHAWMNHPDVMCGSSEETCP